MLPLQLTSVTSQWNFLRNCTNGKKYEIFCRTVVYITFGIFAWPRKNSVVIQLWPKACHWSWLNTYRVLFYIRNRCKHILVPSKGPVKQMSFELWLKCYFQVGTDILSFWILTDFCQSCLLLYQGYRIEAHGLQLRLCVAMCVYGGRSNEEKSWEIIYPLYVVLVVHNQH